MRETTRIAVPAALTGGALSLALGAGMHAAMVRKGVLPDGFGLSLSPLPALAAVATAVLAAAVTSLVAALRVSRIRPVEALGETAAEPGGLPRWRVVTGVVFLVIGLNALGFSAGATGPAANASLGGLVISLIIATAFSAPCWPGSATGSSGGPPGPSPRCPGGWPSTPPAPPRCAPGR